MVEVAVGRLYTMANLLQFSVDIVGRLLDEMGEIGCICYLVLALCANGLKFIGKREVKQHFLLDLTFVLIVEKRFTDEMPAGQELFESPCVI